MVVVFSEKIKETCNKLNFDQMLAMTDNIDTAPIVDEMVAQHELPEVTSAQNTNEMSVPWTIRSLGISWAAVAASLNTLLYTLLGGSALVTLWFACKSPSEMTAFNWHIVLCMIGVSIYLIIFSSLNLCSRCSSDHAESFQLFCNF